MTLFRLSTRLAYQERANSLYSRPTVPPGFVFLCTYDSLKIVLVDKLTIGSSLESAVYASNDTYFFPTLKFGPMFYEEVEHRILLTESKELTWSRINLMLALSGKLLNYQNIQSIKVSENLLKVSVEP